MVAAEKRSKVRMKVPNGFSSIVVPSTHSRNNSIGQWSSQSDWSRLLGIVVENIDTGRNYSSFLEVQGSLLRLKIWGFPGGAVVENLPANAGDTGSSPGLGRSHMPRSN